MKQTAKPKPIITEPRLLVFKEEYGDRIFLVEDDAKLFRVALKVLTERHDRGYWHYKHDAPDGEDAPDFTKEQVASMPESMRPEAERKLREYAQACCQHDRDVQKYKAIENAVESKNGALAYRCLLDRRGEEYEWFSFERLEDLDGG